MLDQSGKYIVFDTLLKFKQKVNLKDDKVILFIRKKKSKTSLFRTVTKSAP